MKPKPSLSNLLTRFMYSCELDILIDVPLSDTDICLNNKYELCIGSEFVKYRIKRPTDISPSKVYIMKNDNKGYQTSKLVDASKLTSQIYKLANKL